MSTSQTVMDRPSGLLDIMRRGDHPGIALAVIVTCQLMFVLDGTVVNIALPKIQSDLHFTATNLSWVFNAYMLAFGGLLLLGGRAGDILGRRRVFIGGVLLFTLASLGGGLATSAGWLIATRIAQGVGAAFAAPSALAFIATSFAEGSQRNRALGIYSAVAAAGGSLGLILGGMLTSWSSWRWVLFINVPVGVAVLLLAPLFIREPARQPGRLDFAGALTATLGMASLVYGFIRAASNGWNDHLTLGAVAVAVALLALFLAIESRVRQPIMPLRLFADRNRAGAYLNMLLFFATMFGVFFFLTQFLQDVLGYSPLQAGVAFLPLTLPMFTSVRIVPRLLPRFGAKPIMVTGAALITIGIVWLAQISPTTGYVPGILGPMVLLGAGVGCSVLPLNVTILAGVRPQDSGGASGVLQTMQQVGGSLGLAILVTVFGTSSRAVARQPSAGVSPQAQAHHILAYGIGSAFSVGAIFASCALIVVLFAITATPVNTSSRGEALAGSADGMANADASAICATSDRHSGQPEAVA